MNNTSATCMSWNFVCNGAKNDKGTAIEITQASNQDPSKDPAPIHFLNGSPILLSILSDCYSA